MSDTAAPRANVELLLAAFTERGDEIALVYGEQRLSYRDLVRRTYQVARALYARGARPGRIITLLGGNAPEMVVSKYAANLIGCGICQLYNGMSAEAHARIIADVDTAFLLVAAPHAEQAEQVLRHCGPEAVLGLGPWSGADDLLELAARESAEPMASMARPEDVQSIRHTGGTTGHPKGIAHTFGNGLRMLRHAADRPLPDYHQRLLISTTLAHAGGGIADLVLGTGGTVVLHDRFEPGAVLATIERERITDMYLLPPLLYQLLDHPDLANTDTSSLRNVLYGGCAANPTRLAEAVKRFGPVFMQFYGQTEAGLVSVLSQEEHRRPELLGTVGRVFPSTELAICDDHGRRVADGERGELWVRTGMEMSGYWKLPELTAQTIQDGWVRTGDVGYLNPEGYLRLVDRVKDMIVVVGGHVYTSEIENLLLEHPRVRAAAVFGTPDPNGAEKVHAAVVADSAVSGDDLVELVRERKGTMYTPSRVMRLERLPLTETGKPDKKALRARLSDVN